MRTVYSNSREIFLSNLTTLYYNIHFPPHSNFKELIVLPKYFWSPPSLYSRSGTRHERFYTMIMILNLTMSKQLLEGRQTVFAKCERNSCHHYPLWLHGTEGGLKTKLIKISPRQAKGILDDTT